MYCQKKNENQFSKFSLYIFCKTIVFQVAEVKNKIFALMDDKVRDKSSYKAL